MSVTTPTNAGSDRTAGAAPALDAADVERRDGLAARLFEATLGSMDLLSAYLGLRLGLYAALADGAARTSTELAATAGVAERYAREWLEQQAVTGLLDLVGPADDAATERRYRLPAAHAEVLLDPNSLSTMAPMPGMIVGAASHMEELMRAWRTGGGVPWSAYGEDVLGAQEAANRPIFDRLLAREWLPAIPDVHARLQQPGARVADVGAGTGWSSIALARGYPTVEVDGIDPDPWSVARATENAVEAGVADRVRFHQVDAADASLAGRYDVALIIEALHDMARPVEVLGSVRGMLAPGGVAIVVDERVAEHFGAPGDEIERLMYGYSILLCLANGMAEQPSAATGTVIRPETVSRYASEAGFRSTAVLPVEHDVFRLYRLDP